VRNSRDKNNCFYSTNYVIRPNIALYHKL